MLPLLHKKNLRSMFDCGMTRNLRFSIFDRAITYTREPRTAIVRSDFLCGAPPRAGIARAHGVAPTEKMRSEKFELSPYLS
jgi:hypothetical protein